MVCRIMCLGVTAGLAVAIVCSIAVSPADAKRRTKYCMAGHYHYGSSSGQRSKKVARREAIASWASFTMFEYGSAWGRFRRAIGRRVSCSRNETGWGCNVEAIPCR